MRNWIAFVMVVLGSALIVAGAASLWLRASRTAPKVEPITFREGSEPTAPPGAPVPRGPGLIQRLWSSAMSPESADRLILWGAILLLLGSVASGTIGFAVQFSIGNK